MAFERVFLVVGGHLAIAALKHLAGVQFEGQFGVRDLGQGLGGVQLPLQLLRLERGKVLADGSDDGGVGAADPVGGVEAGNVGILTDDQRGGVLASGFMVPEARNGSSAAPEAPARKLRRLVLGSISVIAAVDRLYRPFQSGLCRSAETSAGYGLVLQSVARGG